MLHDQLEMVKNENKVVNLEESDMIFGAFRAFHWFGTWKVFDGVSIETCTRRFEFLAIYNVALCHLLQE